MGVVQCNTGVKRLLFPGVCVRAVGDAAIDIAAMELLVAQGQSIIHDCHEVLSACPHCLPHTGFSDISTIFQNTIGTLLMLQTFMISYVI